MAETNRSSLGCQKQTAPRFRQHPIRWAFTSQAFTRWRHLSTHPINRPVACVMSDDDDERVSVETSYNTTITRRSLYESQASPSPSDWQRVDGVLAFSHYTVQVNASNSRGFVLSNVVTINTPPAGTVASFFFFLFFCLCVYSTPAIRDEGIMHCGHRPYVRPSVCSYLFCLTRYLCA